MPFLIHIYNGSAINHYVLEQSLSIGRGPENNIRIDDPTLSAAHAVFESKPEGGYQVRDLNSTNGVLYKGRKVVTHHLSEGDVLVLGTHDMKFVSSLPEALERTHKIKKSWIPGIYYTEG
jgi:pSer/pThr/pTyr-binding forkhead associated (FHA) protein